MILFLGIDPGQKGAIAIINSAGSICRLNDWPGNEVEAARIIRSELDANWQLVAALEKVSAMPKQGVTSMFKFGTSYGMWKGILAALQIPFKEVRPQMWQKGVVSKAQDKAPVMAAAARLFPGAELYGPRGGKKDGRADALLIADWCRRDYVGSSHPHSPVIDPFS